MLLPPYCIISSNSVLSVGYFPSCKKETSTFRTIDTALNVHLVRELVTGIYWYPSYVMNVVGQCFKPFIKRFIFTGNKVY